MLANHEPGNCTRLSVVETKVDYIEASVNQNAEELSHIRREVGEISTHIAKQNGSLPRLEENMKTLLAQSNLEKRKTEQINIRTKAIWTTIGAIVTSAFLIILKGVFGL